MATTSAQSSAQTIGKYRIVAKLADGAMGTVFKGHDPATGATVAIKLAGVALASDKVLLKRFEQEYIAQLRHGKTERAQHADLAHALLDAQFEEQAGQQQRRHHQEEAEIDEVLAKIRGAVRRCEALRFDVENREAPCRRVERGAQGGGIIRRRRREAAVYQDCQSANYLSACFSSGRDTTRVCSKLRRHARWFIPST